MKEKEDRDISAEISINGRKKIRARVIFGTRGTISCVSEKPVKDITFHSGADLCLSHIKIFIQMYMKKGWGNGNS